MPTTTPEHDERIAKMKFSSVYPHYVPKVEKKGRSEQELREVICWLTGYDEAELESLVGEDVTFGEFLDGCRLNPDANLITGVICGYRVEELEDPFIRKCRYLDKLVDELAKGRKMEKILRSP